jgi:hypothetical protein
VAAEWIRLYPVPFRSLSNDSRFAKYQPIRVRVQQHSGDRRPAHAWRRRRRFVEPLMAPSMCEVRRRQRAVGTSLAVFRPREVLDIAIEPANVDAGKREIARAWAAQTSMIDGVGTNERAHQLRALEEVPWSFKYRYVCADPGCRTHTQSIIDWEIAEFYRHVRHYADWRDRLKEKWIGELCGLGRDTAFFVGNQHQHPASLLGVWWPPLQPEQLAFGLTG